MVLFFILLIALSKSLNSIGEVELQMNKNELQRVQDEESRDIQYELRLSAEMKRRRILSHFHHLFLTVSDSQKSLDQVDDDLKNRSVMDKLIKGEINEKLIEWWNKKLSSLNDDASGQNTYLQIQDDMKNKQILTVNISIQSLEQNSMKEQTEIDYLEKYIKQLYFDFLFLILILIAIISLTCCSIIYIVKTIFISYRLIKQGQYDSMKMMNDLVDQNNRRN